MQASSTTKHNTQVYHSIGIKLLLTTRLLLLLLLFCCCCCCCCCCLLQCDNLINTNRNNTCTHIGFNLIDKYLQILSLPITFGATGIRTQDHRTLPGCANHWPSSPHVTLYCHVCVRILKHFYAILGLMF